MPSAGTPPPLLQAGRRSSRRAAAEEGAEEEASATRRPFCSLLRLVPPEEEEEEEALLFSRIRERSLLTAAATTGGSCVQRQLRTGSRRGSKEEEEEQQQKATPRALLLLPQSPPPLLEGCSGSTSRERGTRRRRLGILLPLRLLRLPRWTSTRPGAQRRTKTAREVRQRERFFFRRFFFFFLFFRLSLSNFLSQTFSHHPKQNKPTAAAPTTSTTTNDLGEPGLFYARTAPRTERERAAARKAARLALDTSAHGGASYARLVRAFEHEAREASVHGGSLHGGVGGLASLGARRRSGEMARAAAAEAEEEGEEEELRHKPAGGSGEAPSSSLPSNSLAAVAPSLPSATPLNPSLAVEMGGRRRQGAYAAFLANKGSEDGEGGGGGEEQGQGKQSPLPPRQTAATTTQLSSPPPPPSTFARRPSTDGRKQVTFSPDVVASLAAAPLELSKVEAPPVPARSAAEIIAAEEEEGKLKKKNNGGGNDGDGDDDGGGDESPPVISLRELRDVMRALNFSRGDEAVTTSALADGLARLGYELEPSEARVLAEQVAPRAEQQAEQAAATTGTTATTTATEAPPSSLVPKAAFVASQLDWGSIATNYRDQWLAAAEKVFGDLRQQAGGGGGEGGDGGKPENETDPSLLPASALTAALRDKLPAAEVAHAVEDALLATGAADTEALDFEGFLRMLRCGGVAAGVGGGQGAAGGSGRGGSCGVGGGAGSKVEGSVHAGLEFFDSRYRGAPAASGEHGAGGVAGAASGLDSVAE